MKYRTLGRAGILAAGAAAFLAASGIALAQGIATPNAVCKDARGCGPAFSQPQAPSGPSPEELRQQKERARLKNKSWYSEEAMDYFERKDWDNAIRSFQQALERDPDDADLNALLERAKAEKQLKARLAAAAASPPKPPLNPNRVFFLQRVEYRGEFYVVTADGRRLSGQNAAQVPLDNRARIFTGPSSQVVIYLPDDTTLTIGENAELVLEEFFYDPDPGVRKLTLNVVKGVFRWITGNAVSRRFTPEFVTPVGSFAIRGTDVEWAVDAAGSGYIRLYSGKVEFRRRDTGALVQIAAGQTIRFENSRLVGR